MVLQELAYELGRESAFPLDSAIRFEDCLHGCPGNTRLCHRLDSMHLATAA